MCVCYYKACEYVDFQDKQAAAGRGRSASLSISEDGGTLFTCSFVGN